MKILLTGTSGQLGNAFLNGSGLSDIGQIIVAPRDQMDLSQPERVRACIREIAPDIIINPAAYTAVDKAESDSQSAYTVNATAPQVMAEEAQKLGAALIHFSTDYVFDGNQRDAAGNLLAYRESDQTAPINTYGASKLAGEQAIRNTHCKHLIFRTSWVYSLFGKNFLLTMLRLANERSELKIVNDQWGAPSSAAWLARSTVEILRQQITSDNPDWWQEKAGLYHMTPGGVTSWCGFTEEILRLATKYHWLTQATPELFGIPASDYPTPAKRPVNSCLNTDLLGQTFGLSIPEWQSTLNEYLCR